MQPTSRSSLERPLPVYIIFFMHMRHHSTIIVGGLQFPHSPPGGASIADAFDDPLPSNTTTPLYIPTIQNDDSSATTRMSNSSEIRTFNTICIILYKRFLVICPNFKIPTIPHRTRCNKDAILDLEWLALVTGESSITVLKASPQPTSNSPLVNTLLLSQRALKLTLLRTRTLQ